MPEQAVRTYTAVIQKLVSPLFWPLTHFKSFCLTKFLNIFYFPVISNAWFNHNMFLERTSCMWRRTGSRTGRYTDGQSDRHIDRRTYGQTDRLTDGQTDRQMGKMKSLCLFASLVLSIVCVNHISLKFSSLFQLHNLPWISIIRWQ